MAALGGVGSGAAAASGSAKTAPAASTVDALSMSRLESLLSRMFGPAAFGLDATAHLTTFTMLGIRRSAARDGAGRTGYHTRHHAADPKRTPGCQAKSRLLVRLGRYPLTTRHQFDILLCEILAHSRTRRPTQGPAH